ncbi:hypothetical protein CFO_g3396 [Ceratocystis platani]|uniref:Uncharacterized protein n=1 Tax=Ceratocystis fimbriata f. sp. platani TaxID=88771 RepID=A0A0F8DE43_CERFI|nr:hypothetical protein CFO_g3396 [Ceratocystis platani]
MTASLQESRVSDGSNSKNLETPAGVAAAVPLTRKQKIIRHFKKWWWAYLLGQGVIIAIFLPVTFYAIIPKLMQNRVDDSKLNITRIDMSNTKANSFTLGVDSNIHTPGSIHATVFPFDAYLSLDVDEDYPFGLIRFPKNRSSKNTTVTVEQTIEIINMTSLTRFNTHLLAGETVGLRVKGKPKIKLSGLYIKYKLKFNKVVQLTGFNMFKGLSVTNANISLSASNNFRADTSISNPTVLTLDVGNTTFSNMFNGSDIGTVYIDNLILRPGANNYSIRADIDQTPVTTAILQEPYCETGVMPFGLVGKAVSNGGDNITYFSDALAAGAVSVNIDIGTALSNLGLNVTCSSSSSSSSSE